MSNNKLSEIRNPRVRDEHARNKRLRELESPTDLSIEAVNAQIDSDALKAGVALNGHDKTVRDNARARRARYEDRRYTEYKESLATDAIIDQQIAQIQAEADAEYTESERQIRLETVADQPAPNLNIAYSLQPDHVPDALALATSQVDIADGNAAITSDQDYFLSAGEIAPAHNQVALRIAQEFEQATNDMIAEKRAESQADADMQQARMDGETRAANRVARINRKHATQYDPNETPRNEEKGHYTRSRDRKAALYPREPRDLSKREPATEGKGYRNDSGRSNGGGRGAGFTRN